mgnify:CR=1 FL=1
MVLHISKKQFKYWVATVLLTFPYLKTGFFQQNYTLDLVMDTWKALSFVIVLGWYCLARRKVSKMVMLFMVMEGYLLINTIAHGGNLRSCANSVFTILGVALLYDMLEDFKDEFLSAQLFCFEIMIYINLFTEIAFPNGLYRGTMYSANWFLGYYNIHTRYFIPALMIAYIYMNYTGKRVRTYLLTVAVFLSAILVWSGGVIVSMGGMAITYVLFKNRARIFNYFNYWMIHLIFFVLIIVMKLQNYFRWLIDDVLGKWRSLEGRMLIWHADIELIKKSFLVGYGIEYDEARRRYFDWALHSHNQLLEILYDGGIVYFISMIAIIVMAGKCLNRYKNSEIVKVISIAFLGWCIHGLVEPHITPFLMGMFIIAYHSECYISEADKGKL